MNSAENKLMDEEEFREMDLSIDNFNFEAIDTQGWNKFDALVFVGGVALDLYKKQQRIMRDKRSKRVMASDEFVEQSASGAAEKRQESTVQEAKSRLSCECLGWATKKKRTRSCPSDVTERQPAVLIREERQEPPSRQTMVKRSKIITSDVEQQAGIDLLLRTDEQIPENVKNCIEGLGGSEILLVCKKYLTESDIKKKLHRLMMPESTISSPSFLRDEEQKFLKTRVGNTTRMSEIRVPLLEPTLKTCEVSLRRWEMKKEKSSNVMYVLACGWNEVVAGNGLKIGDLVQVWSFRVRSQLHLALIVALRS